MVSQLTDRADTAHSDYTTHLKTSIVTWLTQSEPDHPQFLPQNKVRHGLHNNTTARSICPMEFDWDNVGYIIGL